MTSQMFEKFSASDVDSAGRGGEYTVQAGFGWTNGVVLWVASRYGKVLTAPTCPPLLAEGNTGSRSNAAFRAAEAASGARTVILTALVGGSLLISLL